MAGEANLAEIQRLASSAADLQAELAFRPTRADIDDLTAVVGELRADVLARDHIIERLQAERKPTADKAVETDELADPAPDDSIDAKQISAEIDEMFRLDYDEDDEETDSVATEINKDADQPTESEYVRLDDEERLRVTLQNGSLHALEEELVRAKERWAEVCAERARLAAQLASLQSKPLRLDVTHVAALAVPVLFACLYYLLLPYIS